MNAKEKTLIFAILFTFWVIRLYYKLYNKKTKKYIMVIGILIVFWMLIRIIKGIASSVIIERLCWYLYYIPLIYIPAIFYICSDELVGGTTKTKKIIIMAISTILFLTILTNDFHQLAFKFPNGPDDYDNYNHNIGYYIACVWIFGLLLISMISLALKRMKIKKDIKAFMPLLLLLSGFIYTILYVMGIKIVRNTNLSVLLSTLICIGIELILYLDLIPNNTKYKKTFENSNLNMMIISFDGKTIYKTKNFKELPNYILNDICTNNVVKQEDKNVIYDIKKNNDSYVVIRKDITELNKLKKEINIKRKMLLDQQESLKREEQIKKELYEITLRKEILIKTEANLNSKKIEAKKILRRQNLNKEDLEKVKMIMAYCKRKSSLIISELNNETYDETGIKMLIKEILVDASKLNITGEVIVSKMNIDSYMMSNIYEVIFNVIEKISNTNIMIFIENGSNIEIKIIIGNIIKIKDKISKSSHNIVITEKHYETDTELKVIIKKEVSK